ncbi:MAG: formylglycine-generating enzyme family protein [Bacteroidota bacterium]
MKVVALTVLGIVLGVGSGARAIASGVSLDIVRTDTVTVFEPYVGTVPGTTVQYEMIPVPGGTVMMPDSTASDGRRTVVVEPLWFGKYETLWDAYNVFLYKLDHEGEDAEVDAVMRPSRPYGAPDRGFGTRGYAAISMTYEGAEQFAYWLSMKTGDTYRLPTEEEWTHACLGDDLEQEVDLEEVAWYWDNAFDTTHPVGSKAPNSFGLHDMLGNAGEWCLGEDFTPMLCGGSFMSRADEVDCFARAVQTPRWNETDPQIPKSMWWLSDGPFAGFRIVREP